MIKSQRPESSHSLTRMTKTAKTAETANMAKMAKMGTRATRIKSQGSKEMLGAHREDEDGLGDWALGFVWALGPWVRRLGMGLGEPLGRGNWESVDWRLEAAV